MDQISVIVVAAGQGTRFGGKENKILAKVDGQPMFLRSVQRFVNREDVREVILVVASEDEAVVRERFGANLGFMGVALAVGGPERCDSVTAGLARVSEEAPYVAVHDAARPVVSADMLDRVFAEARKSGAAILAAPLRGTLKRVSQAGVIDETVVREGLWEAQTPQVFRRELIMKAYEQRNQLEGVPTDDAQLVEAIGEPVQVVESDMSNLKITSKGDLTLASAILRTRPKAKPKGPLGAFEEAQW
jgi:2-C-methyl-D-erythritol 4-phosphate cytidylyltransferase